MEQRFIRRVRLGSGEICGLTGVTAAGGCVASLLYLLPPGGATWLSAILSLALVSLGMAICRACMRQTGETCLYTALCTALGSVVARVAVGLWALAMVGVGGVLLAQLLALVGEAALPEMPGWLVAGCLLISVVALAAGGVIAQGRLAGLLRWVFVALLGLMILAGAYNCRYDRLFPLLGQGVKQVVDTGVAGSAAGLGAIGVLFFGHTARDEEALTRGSRRGLLLGGSAAVICLIVVSMYVTPEMGAWVQHPLYGLTAAADYGQFFQRPGPVFLFLLIPVPLLAAGFLATGGGSLLGRALRIPGRRVPVGIGVAGAAAVAWVLSSDGAGALALRSVAQWIWVVALGVPVLAGLGWLRSKRRDA